MSKSNVRLAHMEIDRDWLLKTTALLVLQDISVKVESLSICAGLELSAQVDKVQITVLDYLTIWILLIPKDHSINIQSTLLEFVYWELTAQKDHIHQFLVLQDILEPEVTILNLLWRVNELAKETMLAWKGATTAPYLSVKADSIVEEERNLADLTMMLLTPILEEECVQQDINAKTEREKHVMKDRSRETMDK